MGIEGGCGGVGRQRRLLGRGASCRVAKMALCMHGSARLPVEDVFPMPRSCHEFGALPCLMVRGRSESQRGGAPVQQARIKVDR